MLTHMFLKLSDNVNSSNFIRQVIFIKDYNIVMNRHRVYWYAISLWFAMWLEYAFNDYLTLLNVSDKILYFSFLTL